VHVAWHRPGERALRSRYVTRVHELPRPEDCMAGGGGAAAWFPSLAELCARERFDLVLPTNDPATVALHGVRDRLDALGTVALINQRAFAVTYDKRATSELARELDLPVPEEVVVTDAADVDAEELLERLGSPVVLKPRDSFAFGRRKWEHQVRKVRDARELRTSLEALLGTGPVLAQRNVPGVGVGVEVLADRGRLLLALQHRRLHEPLEGGGSSYRVTEELDPALIGATRALCAAMDYHGVGMFEFKRDVASCDWWLIEINGRFWGSLPLALAAGADFPWALVELHTRGSVNEPPPYRRGVTCRNIAMDWPWLWRNLRADRRDPELATVGLGTLCGELLRAVTFRDHYDSFARDDRGPFWAELRAVSHDLGRILMDKGARLPYRLPFLRELLISRLRRRAADSARLLFVCKGNICRSPFAEHYARRVLPPHVQILSNGTWPHPNRSGG
jgi:predicted ATP-grasp superfamily ATP-dependent carboligase